jgi:HNH endonuclease
VRMCVGNMLQLQYKLTSPAGAVHTCRALATSQCIRGAWAMTTGNVTIDYDACVSAHARFWSKVVCVDSANDTCWHWLAQKTQRGYGKIKISRKWVLAHRAAWIMTYHTIDTTLTLDHLCRNPACVNPKHLEQVPMRVNTLRGMSGPANNARKTHCRRGHPFDAYNTALTNKNNDGIYVSRRCRTCHRDATRTARQRKRAQARHTRNTP